MRSHSAHKENEKFCSCFRNSYSKCWIPFSCRLLFRSLSLLSPILFRIRIRIRIGKNRYTCTQGKIRRFASNSRHTCTAMALARCGLSCVRKTRETRIRRKCFGKCPARLAITGERIASKVKGWTRKKYTDSFFCACVRFRYMAQLPIASASSFQIVFEGVVGSNYLGNIAIDSISIEPGSCPSKMTTAHTLCAHNTQSVVIPLITHFIACGGHDCFRAGTAKGARRPRVI